MSHLHDGLAAGAVDATRIAQTLTREELLSFAADERSSSEVLERDGTSDPLGLLCEARLTAMLLDDDFVSALSEVRGGRFLRAAERYEWIRQVGLRVANAAMFRHPELAEEVFAALAHGDRFEGSIEEYFRFRRAFVGPMRRWSRSVPRAAELFRFLELAHSLSPIDVARLDLPAALCRSPQVNLDALDVLLKKEPALYHHFLEALDDAGVTVDPEEDEAAVLELASFVKSVDSQLGRHYLTNLGWTVFGILIIGAIAGFFLLGWWGFAVLGALLLWIIIGLALLDPILYRRIVRPAALDAIVRHRRHPVDLVRAIAGLKESVENLDQFEDNLESDEALRVFALSLHVGDVREEAGRSAADLHEDGGA